MRDQNLERWRVLCELAANGQDPDKLSKLIDEINKLLGEKFERPPKRRHRADGALIARLAGASLPQLRVFGLGLLQDGDIGVGVFPQREEVLIRGACLGAIALHGIGAS
jgi:hypothetical protein